MKRERMFSPANTGNSAPRNVCPKADVPGGPAASWLPTQIASANIAKASKGIGMAEGLLGGVLGGEREVKAASTKGEPEAFAAR